MRVLVVVSSFLVFSAGIAALPKHEGALGGTWFMAGPIQEGGVGPENSHLYLWLEGDAARTLYDELEAEPIENPCASAPSKRVGSIQCTNYESGPRCTFAVDIKAQKLTSGSSC